MSYSIHLVSSSDQSLVPLQNINSIQKNDPFKTMPVDIFRKIVDFVPQEDLQKNQHCSGNEIKSCCKGHLRSLSQNINQMILKTRQCITLKDGIYIETPKANYDVILPYLSQLKNLNIHGLPRSDNFYKFLDDSRNSLQSIHLILRYMMSTYMDERPDRFLELLASQTLKTLSVKEWFRDSPSSCGITLNLPNLTSLSYHSNAPTEIHVSQLTKLTTLDLRVTLSSSTIFKEITGLKNLSNLSLDCTHEDFNIMHSAYEAINDMLEEETLPSLTSLHLSATIAFDAPSLTILINKFNQLHTFECKNIQYFDDSCLVLLSTRFTLESVALNFSKITDAGFEEFAQKAPKLKKFSGLDMNNISSLVPLTTHCPDIRKLECYRDSYPKDQEEASSQTFLESLKDLKKFKVLNSLLIDLPFINNHVQNATKIVKDINDSCKYLASVVTLITNEERLRIAQFKKI